MAFAAHHRFASLVIFLGLSLCSFPAHAQGLNALTQLQNTSQAIAKKQFQQCVAQDQNCELPADVLNTVTETPTASANPAMGVACSASPTPAVKDGEETTTMVLLVSELQAFQAKAASSHDMNPYIFQPHAIDPNDVPKAGDLKQWAFEQTALKHPLEKIDPNQTAIRESMNSFYVEGMLQNIAAKLSQISRNAVPYSDEALAKMMADMINSYSPNEADRVALLTTLNDRLYASHKEAGKLAEKKLKDPITVSHLLFNASSWNSVPGESYEDIAQTVATVAEKVFPERDVLVINNGSHSGVLLNDQNNNRTVINWDQTIQKNNNSTPDGSERVGNTRIAKMKDGRLAEIAVLDTETGAVMKTLFSSTTPILQSGFDPSVIYMEFKKETETDQKMLTLRAKVAGVETSKTKMLVFVGEQTKKTSKTQIDMGYAAGLQQVKDSRDLNLVFAVHQGVQQNLIRYVHPKVTLKMSTGVQLDALATKNLIAKDGAGQTTEGLPVSANLQFVQKVEFETRSKNPKAAQFNGNAQLVHSIGSDDWGSSQGTLTAPGSTGILKPLKYTSLHLNQVYVNGNMKLPLSKTLTSKTNVQYQGTNVGQKIDVSTGIEVQSSGGMKIYAFVGYVDASMHGYQTQTSLLTANNGAKTGLTLQTKKGATFSGQVQGIGGSALVGNIKAAIPIFRRTKK
jgi:hypothetical protein